MILPPQTRKRLLIAERDLSRAIEEQRTPAAELEQSLRAAIRASARNQRIPRGSPLA